MKFRQNLILESDRERYRSRGLGHAGAREGNHEERSRHGHGE
jgi:hypothetical protein